MSVPLLPQPLAVEFDGVSWQGFLDAAERWFVQVQLAQSGFRHLAEDLLPKLHEPHLHAALQEIVQTARAHEAQIAGLYRAIGRDVPAGRGAEEVGGRLLAKGQELLGGLQGRTTGAEQWWNDLHQLFLASLNAISAFAAAEQFGFALGLREIVDLTFPVLMEKYRQHRVLQELTLELVPLATLYHTPI